MKGKGDMETYYVLGRKIGRSKSFGRQQSSQEKGSLAAVVYGMVQVRKKQSLGSSLSVPGQKQRQRTSTSFTSRKKSRKNGPHKLQRMLSEMPSVGRKRNRFEDRRMTSSGMSSHSFPDVRENVEVDSETKT